MYKKIELNLNTKMPDLSDLPYLAITEKTQIGWTGHANSLDFS